MDGFAVHSSLLYFIFFHHVNLAGADLRVRPIRLRVRPIRLRVRRRFKNSNKNLMFRAVLRVCPITPRNDASVGDKKNE